MPSEVQFLRSAGGGGLMIVLSIAAFTLALLWAWRPGHPERWLAVAAATGTTLLVNSIYVLAFVAGWWGGAYFTIPLIVQFAINVPFSIAGYTLWLGGYRWLASHLRHGRLIYSLIVLAFIPIVVVMDRINMARGQFTLGGGYTVGIDAIVGQITLWSPVLFYEALRWRQAKVRLAA